MTNELLFSEYTNQNHASLGQLINDLFEHATSALLVVRVDFLYRPEVREQITLETVQEHRCRFLDNRRRNRTLFEHLLGYAWSLEYGLLSGFHHHFLFFYNGQARQADITLGLGIASYFDTVITNGLTHSYVSNFDKMKFEKTGTLGIGAIAHNEITLRNNLLNHVAGYLTKDTIDSGVQECMEEDAAFRRFGKSQSPRPRSTLINPVGRPRSAEMKW